MAVTRYRPHYQMKKKATTKTNKWNTAIGIGVDNTREREVIQHKKRSWIKTYLDMWKEILVCKWGDFWNGFKEHGHTNLKETNSENKKKNIK